MLDAAGKQLSIPLNFLAFDNGAVVASAWPGYAANKAVLDPWLAILAARKLLRAGAAPQAVPAILLTARDPGSTGNSIKVTIANVVPKAGSPEKTKADVTVSVTQTYAGLTLATAASLLGVGAGAGSRQGLAFLAAAPAAMPDAAEADFSGSPAQWDVAKAGGGGSAFILKPRHDEPDATKLHGKISAVDAGAGTFTLTLSWSKTQAGVQLKDLQNTFAFVLKAAAPPSGFALPAVGAVTLSGGSDSPPTPSKGIVLTG